MTWDRTGRCIDNEGMLRTPVLEERLFQAPVRQPAVVEILSGGKKSEATELEERVVTLGVEGCLSNAFGNGVSVV